MLRLYDGVWFLYDAEAAPVLVGALAVEQCRAIQGHALGILTRALITYDQIRSQLGCHGRQVGAGNFPHASHKHRASIVLESRQ